MPRTFRRHAKLPQHRSPQLGDRLFNHAAVNRVESRTTQRKPRSIPTHSRDLTQVPIQSKRSGKHLPDGVRTKMESAFSADFADVKVHEGSEAASVGALAYTQQNHIHFAPGQFKPETPSGQALLGHELAHVLQQRQGRVKPTTEVNGVPVNDDPALEQEADRLGLKAAR
ncbi:MAG: DUF4157 domain-containing protein [Cyanobacteria bacterium J06639_16]